MQNNTLFYCKTCAKPYEVQNDGLACSNCKKTILVSNDIPIFAKDIYWGKVPESELKSILESIEKLGFKSFDVKQQKKLDFTYDEDRADWRFFIPLSKDSVILDFGAGLGRATIPLARISKEVIACDQSLSRLRFLKKRVEAEGLTNVNLLVGDIFDLPLEDNSLDLIVMNGVLEWVGLTSKFKDPREAQINCLKKCYQLLKKGGHLYIGIENRRAMAYIKTPDHGGLLYTGFMPRRIANLYSRLCGNGPYRTYTYAKTGYEKLLKIAGFARSADFYLLYPGYNFPRIIASYDDIGSLKFILTSFKHPQNIIRRLIYRMMSVSIFARLYRFFFYSFGIISSK